jgi:hypothetical protein
MIDTLKRLHRMSRAEVAHRLREQFRRRADKVKFIAPSCFGNDVELERWIEAPASLKEYFREGPARRFYTSTRHREKIDKLFRQHYPRWLERAMDDAAALCRHEVHLLAYRDLSLGSPINWHADAISGFQWPRRYWADYDLVNDPPADAKIVHELNRHQHLPRLAKAFFLTNDESCAREAVDQMMSWIDQNPCRDGINWQSSLELAIRSLSWLWTIFMLLPSTSLDDDRLRPICRSLFAQLDHVYRYPSVYTSPNTHLIGEAAALFIAGVLFPEFPRAQRWREFGEATLIEQIKNQVSDDGVYRELSSYYHCYAADFYLHALALARANRIAFPEFVWSRLAGMFEFVAHLTRPDGTIPLLGDDDGGRVLALSSQNYTSYRDGLCSGAVLFRRPDFKYQAGGFCEESLWLLGEDAWALFNSVRSHWPAGLSRLFADGGYCIQRSGWGVEDSHVTFDCGGLGFGTGGHSHADALSLTLFSGGHEFLIDAGTLVYNGARHWRQFFRSTAAHNTVVVDGESQCQSASTFQWKTRVAARVRTRVALPEIDYIEGEHEGYSRPSNGVTHSRRLIHVRPNYWIVIDQCRGEGEHDFDFLYHFAPDARLVVTSDEKRGDVDCRAQIGDAGLQLSMFASAPIQAEVICGETIGVQGWSSRLYGERCASPVLKASMHSGSPVSTMTFLLPGNRPMRSRGFSLNSSEALAAAIADGDYEDIVVLGCPDRELHLMGYVMRGEFFWLRTLHGQLRKLLAVNACSFSRHGDMVFENTEAIPYVQTEFWENGILTERGENEGKVYVRDLRDRQFQRH